MPNQPKTIIGNASSKEDLQAYGKAVTQAGKIIGLMTGKGLSGPQTPQNAADFCIGRLRNFKITRDNSSLYKTHETLMHILRSLRSNQLTLDTMLRQKGGDIEAPVSQVLLSLVAELEKLNQQLLVDKLQLENAATVTGTTANDAKDQPAATSPLESQTNSSAAITEQAATQPAAAPPTDTPTTAPNNPITSSTPIAEAEAVQQNAAVAESPQKPLINSLDTAEKMHAFRKDLKEISRLIKAVQHQSAEQHARAAQLCLDTLASYSTTIEADNNSDFRKEKLCSMVAALNTVAGQRVYLGKDQYEQLHKDASSAMLASVANIADQLHDRYNPPILSSKGFTALIVAGVIVGDLVLAKTLQTASSQITTTMAHTGAIAIGFLAAAFLCVCLQKGFGKVRLESSGPKEKQKPELNTNPVISPQAPS